MIDFNTKEGKLLFAAISLLMNEGPKETKDKTLEEVLFLLEKAVEAMERM